MSIRLAFSGGGFRATLFHLGVVRYLRETNRLEDVTDICSVSGGSIMAAHLVLNWDKYTGTDKDFQDATDELVRFIQYDVRGRILRRWVFAWVFVFFLWFTPPSLILYFFHVDVAPVLSSIAWLALGAFAVYRYKQGWSLIRAVEREYDSHLFHGAGLGDLGKKNGSPSVHILTTNLTTGEMCSFDKTGFHVFDGTAPRRPPYKNPAFSLSRAVAASSAFPVVFSPVFHGNDDYGGATHFTFTHALADGGIYENLGLEAFFRLYPLSAWPTDCDLVLSDGQGVFMPQDLQTFSLLPSRANRTIDVLMNRVSHWQLDQAKQLGTRFHLMRSSIPVDDPLALDDPTQAAIARWRTDLDAFSNAEIHLLVYHGYCVARFSYAPPPPANLGSGQLGFPPKNAYTGNWKPTPKELSARVVTGRRKLLGPIAREFFLRPLNLASLFTVCAIFLCSYPVLYAFYPSAEKFVKKLLDTPVRLVSWPLQFAERTTGENAVRLQSDQPIISDLWQGIAPNCTTCRQMVLRTVSCGEITNGHPIREGEIRLRCAEPNKYKIAGAIFLVILGESEKESWRLIHYASEFESTLKIHLPDAPPGACLVAVLKLNNYDSSGFQPDLTSHLVLEIEK